MKEILTIFFEPEKVDLSPFDDEMLNLKEKKVDKQRAE